MKYVNLSKHSSHFRLVSNSENGKEYWAGGSDWVDNPDHSEVSILGAMRGAEWLARMEKRGIAAWLEPVAFSMQVYYWKGLGWVVISTTTGKPHRIKFVNGRGQSWYIKDVGTTERTLCINYSKDVHADIAIRDDQIGEVTYHVEGAVMKNFGTFTIPTDSNLIYQFEIEVESVKELP